MSPTVKESVAQNYVLPAQQQTWVTVCRVFTGLCIMADGGWFVASFETRAAYFKQVGVPAACVYIIAMIYIINGLRIAINRSVETSCMTMIVSYAVIIIGVHLPVGPGGIGDYPKERHNDFNLMQIIKYFGMIGTIFIIYGFVDYKRRGGVMMDGTRSYSIAVGRMAIGFHFVVENLWFRLMHYGTLSKQVSIMGGRPFFQVWLVGLLYVALGYLLWLGKPSLRRVSALCSGLLTILLVLMDRNSLTMSVGIYNIKFEAAFHHFVINLGITIGCILVYLLGDIPTTEYKKS